MKKPEKLPVKLLGLGIYVALLALWQYWKLPCVFRALTSLPCPTCGMTRAWQAAFRGDLLGAFLQHPMFWSIPVLVLFLFFDGQLFARRRVNAWILGTVLAALFLIYFARIFGFLGVLSPL